MSGAFGFSKETQRSDQRIEDQTPQQIKALLDPFQRVFENLLGSRKGDPLKGIPQSPQSKTGYSAPITQAEQTALTNIAAQAGPGTARNQLLDKTLSGQFVDPASNPFLADYIKAAQRQTAETYENVLGRVLPGQFTQAGQQVQPGGSSAFDTAAAIEARGFANAIADIGTGISFGNFEAERQRQQEAVTMSQQEMDTSVKNLQAQALPRLIEQYGLDQGLAEFKQRSQQLLQLLSLLSGGVLTSGQATTTHSEGDSIGIKMSGGVTQAGSI